MNADVLKIYAICTCILSALMLGLSLYTGAGRGRTKHVVNPEDTKLGEGIHVGEAEHPDVARRLRMHRNALENIVIFYALGLLAVLLSAAPTPAKAFMILFTAARLLHTAIYLAGAQPWRTIVFAVGSVGLVGLLVLDVMAAVALG